MTRAARPNLYFTGILKRKYGQLKGLAADLLEDRPRIATDMEHVGAVLLMFDPAADLDAIAPIRPYKPARGRWNRDAMKVLREANGPLTAIELARRVIMLRGVPDEDTRTRTSIVCSLHAVLRRLERQGLVTVTGKPRRWAIAS
ncbi:MAG TPA: hypothetical protein VHW60_24265 [Caulobacteraceae bacterium]|jgi:hypothetical protein|nr:hypothetical protein [Caulobacteraceae bacterium]